MWRFAIVLTCDTNSAEDLVQATCVRALERRGQYRLDSHFDRWLMTILRSIWQNDLRAATIRKHEGFSARLEAQLEDYRNDAEQMIFLSQVLDIVDSMPEVQRSALLLVSVEGHSIRAAAAILGIPEGTLMSRMARARHTLRQKLGHRSDLRQSQAGNPQ